MERRRKYIQSIGLFLIIFLPGVLFIWVGKNSEHHFETLEHYGPRKAYQRIREGDTINDTLYHRVPDLRFTDRHGDERRLKELDGRAFLVEFFREESVLKRMAVEFHGIDALHFLSLLPDTMMGEEELRYYSRHIRADSLQWTFGRAPMERIEQFAVEGCFKGAAPPDTIRKLIRHPVLVLLDEEYHVRGIYEGPHAFEIDRVSKEIRLLMKEMDQKKDAAS